MSSVGNSTNLLRCRHTDTNFFLITFCVRKSMVIPLRRDGGRKSMSKAAYIYDQDLLKEVGCYFQYKKPVVHFPLPVCHGNAELYSNYRKEISAENSNVCSA